MADINIARILRLLWQKKRISRGEIASILQLDKSTVTKITSYLSEKHLIQEAFEGNTGPQGGRKPVFIELVKDFACVGGIEINPERLSCTLLDLQGSVVLDYRKELTPADFSALSCTGIFYEAYNFISAEAEKKGVPLAGVGIGLPAYINSRTGTIVQSIPLLVNKPLAFLDEISEKVSVPVYLENDARCCCYSELVLKNDSWRENMLYVLVEYRPIQPVTGAPKNLSVGLGIVFNGKVLHGSECSAGEFRSVLWQEGNRSQFLNGERKLLAIEDASVVNPIFEELAQNTAFLVNTLNIDKVYVGGLPEQYALQLTDIIRKRVDYQWPYTNERSVHVNTASLAENAVSFGAAGLVLEKLFRLPGLEDLGSRPAGKFRSKSLIELYGL